jgi:hypothetical protein
VPFLERVAERRNAPKAIIRSRKEEVVVVKDKDVNSAARLQVRHFRRNVINVAQPVPVTRRTLTMQCGNAAERTTSVAAATSNERRNSVA